MNSVIPCIATIELTSLDLNVVLSKRKLTQGVDMIYRLENKSTSGQPQLWGTIIFKRIIKSIEICNSSILYFLTS